MRLAQMESVNGHDMSQSSKSRPNFLIGVTGATGIKRVVAIGSLLVAGRVTVIIVATASTLLGSRATSALADAAVQDNAPTCVACHGTHGEGTPGGVPRLAGQNADYMSHALSMFKAGTRAGAIMQPIARNLTDAEIRRLADYFSMQNAPLAGAAAPASPQLVLAGKQLAETGDANMAACFSCHAAQGKGNGARFPSIAGEPAQFVINRLHEFQARARGKTPQPGTMTAVASTLDERQIDAAAAYLSQLER
jgi:cytochrome c553